MKKDDRRWNALIELLKEYNQNLRSFGPKESLIVMEMKKFDEILSLPWDKLFALVEAASYEVRTASRIGHETSPYQDIALAAGFRAAVVSNGAARPPRFPPSAFRITEGYALFNSRNATLALQYDYPQKNVRSIVLIEWMTVRWDIEKEKADSTASMLCNQGPSQLLLPRCHGIVEDMQNRRCGLILAPPDHIFKNVPGSLLPGSISHRRMPVSLHELLERKTPRTLTSQTLDLGIRFEVARKLVDAVHMMHCVGWVHKNIRASMVLFFPDTPPIDEGLGQQYSITFRYDKPLLIGFDNARVDDVINDPGDNYGFTPLTVNVNQEYHQHPDKRNDPNIRYSRSHDIYSLGCILLELGLWRPLSQIAFTSVTPHNFRLALQHNARNMHGITGGIYARAVSKCLSVDAIERSDASSKAMLKLCSEVAAELGRCVA